MRVAERTERRRPRKETITATHVRRNKIPAAKMTKTISCIYLGAAETPAVRAATTMSSQLLELDFVRLLKKEWTSEGVD